MQINQYCSYARNKKKYQPAKICFLKQKTIKKNKSPIKIAIAFSLTDLCFTFSESILLSIKEIDSPLPVLKNESEHYSNIRIRVICSVRTM